MVYVFLVEYAFSENKCAPLSRISESIFVAGRLIAFERSGAKLSEAKSSQD